MQNQIYSELENLRQKNGLYTASTGQFYQKFVWLRDTFYESLPNLLEAPEKYEETYRTLLSWLKKVEAKYSKFSAVIENPQPKEAYRYLHARIDVENFDEVHGNWGNKQHDAVGAILYGIALGERAGITIIKDNTDIEIINLVYKYLEALEYWKDPDSGIWEEQEEIRASSIAAVWRGLRHMKSLCNSKIDPTWNLLQNGEEYLKRLFPYETLTRQYDMALLTLIFPFKAVNADCAKTIIYRVENALLRKNGVIRYKGDKYYNNHGKEAEWTMGLAFLGLAYAMLGDWEMAENYYKMLNVDKCNGRIPELYFGGTDTPNENNPLGWSCALTWLLKRSIITRNEAITGGY